MTKSGVLRLREVAKAGGEALVVVTADSPAPGIGIVDVNIGTEFTPAPLHWRVGDWTKPPLDIALSPGGRMEAIQIVFQDEWVSWGDEDAGQGGDEAGVPSFEIENWPSNRYLDGRAQVRASRSGSGHLILTIDGSRPIRFVSVGKPLTLGFDHDNQLVEITIGPLDAAKWRMIGTPAPQV